MAIKVIENSIYVGCGLTFAPAEFREEVFAFKDLLRPDYQILDFTWHLGKLAQRLNVYNYDTRLVRMCQMFVSIYDYPSTGLGIETQVAINQQKSTLGLVRVDRSASKIVRDIVDPQRPFFTIHTYHNLLEDGVDLVHQQMAKLQDVNLSGP